MKESNILSLFPIPAMITNISRDFTKEELQLCITDIPMTKNQEMTNHQSKDYYLFDSHADILKDIKLFCEYHLKLYLEEIEGVDTNLAGLRITQSWLNRTKPGEHHHSHYHPNSYLSAVFYITCLPNDHIVFRNRSSGLYNNIEFPKKKSTEWNATGISQNVIEGDLIIFPSWVSHSVNRNETKNRERISLSFNTYPIGEMGNYNDATHLKL